MNRFACWLTVCVSALAFSIAGCGNSDVAALQKGEGPEIVTWDALTALQSPDVMMGVGRNAEMGNFAGLKSHVQGSKFVEAVAAFEKEPIPSKQASPEREANRKELIDNLKDLIEAAKTNAANDKLKEKVGAVQASMTKLTTGSGK